MTQNHSADGGEGSARHSALVPPRQVDIESFVRNDFDARLLVVLWSVKRAFMPTLLLGLILGMAFFLVIANDPATAMDEISGLSSPGELVRIVFSPFTVAVVAIVGRFVLGLVALGAAYPLVRIDDSAAYRNTNVLTRAVRKWMDRWKMARAYRAVRWTWEVREIVSNHLEGWRRWWRRWDVVMTVLTVLLGAIAAVLFVILNAQLPAEVFSALQS